MKNIIMKNRFQYQTNAQFVHHWMNMLAAAVAIAFMMLVSATAMALPPPIASCDPNAPGVNPIIGTEGRDFLRGTPGDDVIMGLGGNDTIFGFGGNDCIDGGEGNDLILAREGDDLIIGGSGNDRIFANRGADIVHGGAGDDQIFGAAGDDQIDGNAGEDKINGGPGTDACANGVLTQCEEPIVVVPPESPQSIISGRVFEADGSAVSGVSISAFKNGEPFSFPENDSPIQLGADGSFEIFLDTEEEVTLKFDADGFATQILPIKAPALEGGRVALDIMMIARGEAQTVNASTGGTFTGTDGASITIEGGSFVDPEGNPITNSDNIVLTVTPVDMSTPGGIATFPGEFSGVAEGETAESPIVSFGVVEYDLTLESTGEKVQLAEEETADILMPLYKTQGPAGGDFVVGDSIPVWYLDELKGIWIQEGSGLVVSSDDSPTGLAVQATVAHFSWWNIDVEFINPAIATITVVDLQGMTGTAYVRYRSVNVDNGGTFKVGETTPALEVERNIETCFWAVIFFDDNTSGTTAERCYIPDGNENFSLILGLSASPLDIVISPGLSGSIEGDLDQPIQIIDLRSASKETEVSYEIINGSLPNGMSLNPISSIGANITGIPNETGTFTVEIKGTDSDGNMDFITLTYSILATSSSLIWQDDIAVTTNMMTWFEAISYCEGLELNGRNDWKLPTEAYFLDMVDAVPTWSNKFFGGPTPPDMSTGVYWLASEENPSFAHIFVHDSQRPGEIQASEKAFFE